MSLNRPKAQSYGSFTQEGTLDGLLISVGGKDETISIRLQNGDTTYANCKTNRTLARELGKHMFEPIRISGSGRWMREADGTETLKRFLVRRFVTLAKGSMMLFLVLMLSSCGGVDGHARSAKARNYFWPERVCGRPYSEACSRRREYPLPPNHKRAW